MSLVGGFAAFVEPRLHHGTRLRIHHVSTSPVAVPPLYAAGPGKEEEKTWCESHFLTTSQQHGTEETGDESHILVLGLEILIFTTDHLTTIFVSKADSTGFLTRQASVGRGQSIAFALISAFLEYLLRARSDGPRVVLSLFARSQNQYLFPGSVENPTKHILDDRQLIKWWCRVIDPIVRRPKETSSDPTVTAYVVVPGCEPSETKAFFPPSARTDPVDAAKWINRYPVDLLVKDTLLPPRSLVPRFPDDPKARFLDDLDGTHISEDGSWKGLKTLDQFWEMMSYRQECSAGRLVGFIWAIVSRSPVTMPLSSKIETDEVQQKRKADNFNQTGNTMLQNNLNPEMLKTFDDLENNGAGKATEEAANDENSIMLAQTTESQLVADAMSAADASAAIAPPAWPRSTQGQILLNSESYTLLMDYVLQLDFAGQQNAKQSTKDWVSKAKDLGGAADFGVEVTGRLIPSEISSTNTLTVREINVLTTVRKKRKVEAVEQTKPPNESAIVNSLGSNIVRKKPKA